MLQLWRMNNDCLVCKNIRSSYGKLLQTEYWHISVAPHQSFLGKCYVSLNKHKSSLSELNENEWVDFGKLAAILESTIKEAFGADMFNWTCLMNDAYYETNNPNPHVHWHVRPRYDHNVEINGYTFTDEQFGRHYRTRWDGFKEQRVDEEKYRIIKNQLLSALNDKI